MTGISFFIIIPLVIEVLYTLKTYPTMVIKGNVTF